MKKFNKIRVLLLSEEELSDLMLALNEADHGRVAALLPEREDDLVTE